MAIIQQPDALSLSGNLKKLIISSGGQISFSLTDGATTLIEATYEPGADGQATIDIQDIVVSRLSYLVSSNVQSNIAKTFTATVDGTVITFKVIRAGVANLADTPANWLQGNFLTWQPTNKQITYYSPEWLTYYAVQACKIQLKAYFPDNTVQNINLSACEAGKAFTVNVQYALVAGLLGQKYPTHYDVWAEDLTGNRLSYIQRYLYSEAKSELEQWFLFENSLGGLDTIRAYGDTDFNGEHDHKLSTTDDVTEEYQIDTTRNYSKNTGYLDEYERRWLLDFFPSKKKYIYSASALRKIIVSESDVKYSSSDLPSTYTFTYRFTDTENATLLNLIRNNNIPDNITLPNLSSPDFSLPPRLSEFPRVSLHEGVIIPALDPNNESLTVTTLGELYNVITGKTLSQIPGADTGGQLVNILKELDTAPATDNNVFSALRVILEISKHDSALSDSLKDLFLSKINPDTAKEIITFLKGIIVNGNSIFEYIKASGLEIGDFTPGVGGSGSALKMVNGSSLLEVDQLFVRQRAEFISILIHEAKSIGGQLILSAAAMLCTKVEDRTYSYRCYFDSNNGKVSNLFDSSDFARCQIFTGTNQKFYWRKVMSVGPDYIDLSKTFAATNSDIPKVGDTIFQLGSTNKDRQGAMILSTVGIDAPSFIQYSGIDSYTLVGKATTKFTRLGNWIDGKSIFTSNGDNVEDELNRKSTTFLFKPLKYKKKDQWILAEDIVLDGISYKKGQALYAVYETGSDSDWRRVIFDEEVKTTDGVNLVRNYDFRYGLSLWGDTGEIAETEEALPTEMYNTVVNVWGDEYSFNYAVSTDDNELISLD